MLMRIAGWSMKLWCFEITVWKTVDLTEQFHFAAAWRDYPLDLFRCPMIFDMTSQKKIRPGQSVRSWWNISCSDTVHRIGGVPFEKDIEHLFPVSGEKIYINFLEIRNNWPQKGNLMRGYGVNINFFLFFVNFISVLFFSIIVELL